MVIKYDDFKHYLKQRIIIISAAALTTVTNIDEGCHYYKKALFLTCIY